LQRGQGASCCCGGGPNPARAKRPHFQRWTVTSTSSLSSPSPPSAPDGHINGYHVTDHGFRCPVHSGCYTVLSQILHTQEVRGSNPLLPISFSNRRPQVDKSPGPHRLEQRAGCSWTLVGSRQYRTKDRTPILELAFSFPRSTDTSKQGIDKTPDQYYDASRYI
jgi:hypothetical protein